MTRCIPQLGWKVGPSCLPAQNSILVNGSPGNYTRLPMISYPKSYNIYSGKVANRRVYIKVCNVNFREFDADFRQ